MTIISLYTSLLIFIFVILSIRTIRVRRRYQIAIGHTDNQDLLRASRAHANFAEYVPLCLIGIFFVEYHGASAIFVHILGSTLLIARIIHSYGISQSKENFRFRVCGMALTFLVLIFSAFYLLFKFL
jgi:uncharacterized membrane protein YecN with MAPEG domain